jgi:subtilisin family serine protease
MKPKKIDPALMRACQDFAEQGLQGLARHVRAMGLAHVDLTPKPPSAVVFLHCSDTANFEHLAQEGIVINQRRGKVRTGIVPIAAVEKLSDESKVKRILASRRLRPLMDIAPGKVKLPAFRSASGLSGNAVVVGIVDTGIDARHPDFQGRVNRIWDQTDGGPGVAEGSYGLELSGAALESSKDTDGHGTHVAGIAAGAGAKFGGVASKATLVVVKTDFQDAHIADGIRYVFRVAGELGLPAVVNLSLGGHFDAHDGSDSLSQLIDQESGRGRIVCCAAGNEGNDNIHALVQLGAADTRTARFMVPQNAVGLAELNGWYPGGDRLQVAVRRPGPGGLVTEFQKVITTGQFSHSYQLGNARIRIQTPGPDPDNGDHNFRVTIRHQSQFSAVPHGVWQLLVRNTAQAMGPLHIWALDDQDSPQVLFTGNSVTDSHKIGSPGASAQAITVASYTTRVKWKDIDSNTQETGLALDDISDFSSEGPLRNGSRKPDVSAPGAMLVSCLSRDSQPEREMRIDDLYLVSAGTSMACPFISGIVALLLERDPQLTPASVKQLLKANSSVPGSAAGHFDAKWGFGLIDAAGL